LAWNRTNRLSKFNLSRDDPSVADASSEKIIMEIDMPYLNHNEGQIRFGTDGYLCIPTGDGGRADDTGLGHTTRIGNAQDLTNPLSTILRIDINNASGRRRYGIPPDNPFISVENARSEIFSYGFRNRAISFDADGNGRLFASDPWQIRWAEADMVIKGGNYGWNITVGSHLLQYPGQIYIYHQL
jgi:glucose/arabinose dehydrogenase